MKEMNLFRSLFRPGTQKEPSAPMEQEVSADTARTSKPRDSIASGAGPGSTGPSVPLSPAASTNDLREATPPDEGSQESADAFHGLPSWMRRNKNGVTVDLDALGPGARARLEEE